MPRSKDPTPYLFLCNGAKLSSKAKRWKDANPRPLSTDRRRGNVRVRVDEIAASLSTNVPLRAADLIEIAACTYIADQMARRTGGHDDYGDRWYRDIRIEFAVRDIDFWRGEEAKSLLTETLRDMSGDDFEIGFSAKRDPSSIGDYLPFQESAPNPEGVERVALFSGGLDSLAGAIDAMLNEGQNVALVSHKPVSHMASLQEKLVRELEAAASARGVKCVPISVWMNKKDLREQDYTHRTRSFFYVSIGSVVARLFGLDGVDFFENGVVSINLPLARHEFGARATRTTHPQTLANFQHLLSRVFGRPFGVRNEYLWKTKQDIVEVIADAGLGRLVPVSLSCVHTKDASQARSHCGLCSQCISRRVATLGALPSSHDPATLYRSDVLLAPRARGEDLLLAERFLGLAEELRSIPNAGDFSEKHAQELSRITPYVELDPAETTEMVFELHSRHAQQVNEVRVDAMRTYVEDFASGTVPDTSMLMYAFKQQVPGDEKSRESESHNPTNDAEDLVLSRTQMAVLQVLCDAQTPLLRAEVAEAVGRSPRTVGPCLRVLREAGFIRYPNGERSGAIATTAGCRHMDSRGRASS